MVDLVKIRRMAKEKKDAEEAQESTASAEPAADASPPVAAKPPRKKKAAKAKANKAEAPATKASGAGAVRTSTPKGSVAVSEPIAAVKEPRASRKPAEATVEVGAAVEPSPGSIESAESDTVTPELQPDTAQSATPQAAEEGLDKADVDRLEKFKREAGKRRGWFAEAQKSAGASEAEADSDELELLRFRLAGEEYAVDIEKIVEIVPPRGTTRVPNADPTIVGIMSLRGTIVTVFDLRRKLGHPPLLAGQGIDPRMIVVERAGETAGFLVDRVSRVVKLDPSEIESHPVVSAAEQSDYVDGVFQASDGLVILLDLEKILASQN